VTVEVARAGLLARYGALPRVPVGSVEDKLIGEARTVRVRIYRPDEGVGQPVLVFLHGGGFVIGSVDTHDALCRQLCIGARAIVVSVDYALAPEAKYPAGLEDCLAAIRWVAGHAQDLGGDPERLALAGDSAGANLAIVSAMRLLETGGPRLAALLLAYPVTDSPDPGRNSYVERGEGYGLTADAMRWFFDHYLADPASAHDPDVAPLRSASVAGFPPIFLITAEFDPLRDEGIEFARKLADADVEVTHVHYDDVNHGFLSWAGTNEPSDRALRTACRWLTGRLG
jgi:acetyl esterase